MDINYWAAAYLAHAALRTWLKPSSTTTSKAPEGDPTPSPEDQNKRPRHFIMTSSVGAFAGLAGYATYAPAKAAMRSLADNLRSEINLYNGHRRSSAGSAVPETDIKIHCVFPGSITSPGYEQENLVKHPVTKILEEGDQKQDEDEVAEAAVKGLEKGGYLIATQMVAQLMRVSMLGGSPRNGFGVVDTVFGWVASVVWLFVGPGLEGKVFEYGRGNKVVLPE